MEAPMPVVPFDITPMSPHEDVHAGQDAMVVFNVKNRVPSSAIGFVTLETTPADIPWITLRGSTQRSFHVEATEQLVFDVRPPQLPKGQHQLDVTLRVKVARLDSVDQESSESAQITLTVRRGHDELPRHWWPYALAGLALGLLVMGIVMAATRPKVVTYATAGQPCAAVADCIPGTTCWVDKCLVADLGLCTIDTDCLSGRCRDGHCLNWNPGEECTLPVGCGLTAGLSGDLTCIEGLCLHKRGTACTADLLCETASCFDGRCEWGGKLCGDARLNGLGQVPVSVCSGQCIGRQQVDLPALPGNTSLQLGICIQTAGVFDGHVAKLLARAQRLKRPPIIGR
jgi:hypothetical protein